MRARTIGQAAGFRPGTRLLLVVLGVALALAGLGAALAWRGYDGGRQRVVDEARLEARARAGDVAQFVSGRLDLLQAVARNPALAGSATARGAAVVASLDAQALGFTGGVAWLDPDGRVLAAGGAAAPAGREAAAPEVVAALAGRPAVGAARSSAVFRGTVVVLAVPIAPAPGRPAGVLAAAIGVDWIDAIARQLVPGPRASLYVADRAGQLIAGPGVLAPAPPVSTRPLEAAAGAGATTLASGALVGATGVAGAPDRLVAFGRDARVSGWTVVIERSRAAAFAGPRRTLLVELGVLAGALALALGAALLAARTLERLARTEAEAHARVERLQASTAVLARAATAAEVCDAAIDATLAALGADGVLIAQLHHERQELELLAWGGSLTADDQPFVRRRRLPLDADVPLCAAVRTGRPIWLEARDEWRRLFPAGAELSAIAGAAAVVPLVGREGEAVGALGILFADERRVADGDRDVVVAFAGQAALALERARLLEAERAARARTQALEEVAVDLAGALTPEEVARVVVGRGLTPLGAHGLLVVADGDDGETLRTLAASGVPEAVRHRYDEMPRSAPTLVAEAIRTGQPVVAATVELDARFAQTAETLRLAGSRAAAAVPLLVDGRTIGALAVAVEEEHAIDREALGFLAALGEVAAQALERARLFVAERRARAERTLAERRYRSLVEATSDVVWRAAPEGGASWLGDGWLALTGQPPEQGAGDGWLAVLHPDDRAQTAAAWRAAVENGSEYRIRHRLRAAAGGYRCVESRAIPVRDAEPDGRVVEWIGTTTDVHEQALAAERVGRLREAAAALARAESPADVARAVLEPVLAAVGATAGSVVELDRDDPETLVVEAAVGYPEQLLRRWQRFPLDDGTPVGLAILTGTTLLLDRAGAEARFPGLTASLALSGNAGLAALPLVVGGRIAGAIGMSFASIEALGRVDLETLEELAEQSAAALGRARRHEREREIAHGLQESMLGAQLPARDRVAIHALYRPATSDLEVGGDWYDAFALADGRLALVVGDVIGRGLQAATEMGQLRSAVRALAIAVDGPARLLDQLDLYVETHVPTQFATLAYLELDPATGRLRYAFAGHPPALVVPPDGEPAFLSGGRSGPLGTLLPPARVEAATVLAPGSSLLLYTDGLVERRGESLDAGLARLARAVGRLAAQGEPARLCERLADELGRDRPQADDVCVLAVRLEPAASLRVAIPAEPRRLVDVRTALGAWLGEVGVADDEVRDVVLACGEAAANAIEHAYAAGPGGGVVVEAALADGELEVVVRDRGAWRAPGDPGDRGRGIQLMRALMDGVVVDQAATGTTVRLRRRLAAGEGVSRRSPAGTVAP